MDTRSRSLERRGAREFPESDETLREVFSPREFSPIDRDFPTRVARRLGEHVESRAQSPGREAAESLLADDAAPHSISRCDRTGFPIGSGYATPSIRDDLSSHADAVIFDFQKIASWFAGVESQTHVARARVVSVLDEFDYGHHIVSHQVRAQGCKYSRMDADRHPLETVLISGWDSCVSITKRCSRGWGTRRFDSARRATIDPLRSPLLYLRGHSVHDTNDQPAACRRSSGLWGEKLEGTLRLVVRRGVTWIIRCQRVISVLT